MYDMTQMERLDTSEGFPDHLLVEEAAEQADQGYRWTSSVALEDPRELDFHGA